MDTAAILKYVDHTQLNAYASWEDFRLFKKHIGLGVKIKAAGGIRIKKVMEEYLQQGCRRIGSSSAGSIE